MWLLVGITVLLARAAIGNLTEEGVYYLTEANEDRSIDGIENPRYEKLEATSSAESKEDRDDPGTNRDPKLSIDDEELRDKSAVQRQAPAPLATLLYWPDGADQVVGMEQRRNPMMQERRNPALFSPWGGKRDVQQRYKTITKIRRPVRVPFNSWGGKRDGKSHQRDLDVDAKRGKFFNWGGKKSVLSSWGGRLARPSEEFSPRANYRYYQRHRKPQVELDSRQLENDLDSAEERYENVLARSENGEKRKSMTTGGDITTSGSTMSEVLSRVPFEPWGGKKRRILECGTDCSRFASVSLILRKIGQLIPSNG